MSDNPFEAPEGAAGAPPTRERIAHGVAASLFSRIVSAAIDFIIWGAHVVAFFYVLIEYENNPLKALIGQAMTTSLYLIAQLTPAYFRGATIGMAVMVLQYDSHIAPGARSLFVMVARNLGFLSCTTSITTAMLLPEIKNETLNWIIAVPLLVGIILLPLFQILSGLFVFGPKRLTLQDRVTGTRIVYTGRLN